MEQGYFIRKQVSTDAEAQMGNQILEPWPRLLRRIMLGLVLVGWQHGSQTGIDVTCNGRAGELAIDTVSDRKTREQEVPA